jgi:pimeloyl-ACP methyl ester carboxylesterase
MTIPTRLPGTPVPMHYWTGADGIRIAGDSWGDPAGPLVLLQHGGGQTRHAWKGAGEALGAAGYHAVAFDARGHGDSGWSAEGDYGHEAMVADLGQVIDGLSGNRPVLVGASMGGVTSLAAIGGDKVGAGALVLVDIAPQIEAAGAERILDFMRQKPEGFSSLEEVADAISTYQPQRARPRNLDGLAKNLRVDESGRYFWHWDPKFLLGPRSLKNPTEWLETCAARLSQPVLLVRGGLSDVLTEDGAQAFLAICPHAEYVNVTDAAHMVAGDRNDIFSGAVIEFLRCTVPVDGTGV